MGLEIYDTIEYFLGHPESFEQAAWEMGQLRVGNQWAAIAYAFGFKNFQQVRELFKISDNGYNMVIGTHPLEWMSRIWSKATRIPQKGVLEIGGGRGEVSCVLQGSGIYTQMVEPCRFVSILIDLTKEKFGVPWPSMVYDRSLKDSLEIIDWSIDTVMFIESIEHIEKEELDHCIPYIKKRLAETQGYLIVTNWIDYWPIQCTPPYHCTGMDDIVYNWLAEGGTTIYREGSHLVVQF